MIPWIPPLDADDVPETRNGPNNNPKSWHVGCMVTQSRAVKVAVALYPEDVSDGGDCRAEVGREGSACRICEERNNTWKNRVKQVRAAMLDAFK